MLAEDQTSRINSPSLQMERQCSFVHRTNVTNYYCHSNNLRAWHVKKYRQYILPSSVSNPFSQISRHFLLLVFGLTVIVARTAAAIGEATPPTIKGIVGEDIDIPCVLSSKDNDCGDIHSVKWYEDGNRVYVYSSIYGYSLPEGRLQPDRAVFLANATPPILRVNPIQLEDEGVYRCDVTYVTLKSGCPTVSSVELIAIAKPNSPEILLRELGYESKDVVVTSTTIGPFHEGDQISLICEASGGKPAASVTWWNGTQSLGGTFTEDIAEDGSGTGISSIQLRVTRSDLLARYDCQVTHEALEGALVSWIQMDVYVPPLSLDLESEDSNIFEGDKVTLSCSALKASPAATITWYNGSDPLPNQPTSTVQSEEGGTFSTFSTLTFVATRFDDDEVFACHASNKATTDGPFKTLVKLTTLTVFYAPIVRLLQDAGELALNETDKLLLDCLYEANPGNVSDVVWLKDSQPFQLDDGSGSGSGNGDSRLNKFDEGSGSGFGDDNDQEQGRFQLVINKVSRSDAGEFQCMVSNIAGTGMSENSVNVTVLYRPEVRFSLFPTLAVEHVTNVTMICNVEDAYPEEVLLVRWYRDNELFNETLDTTLVIPQVDRSFYSNYSCQAMNSVGWGNVSESLLLDILYTPGRARITFEPQMVVKGQRVTLFCNVEDPGNPPVKEFQWKRGEFLITDVHTYNWTIEMATLQTEEKYVCIPKNAAGEGIPGELQLEVHAPPALIGPMMPYQGALETAADVSLNCQVECSPLCQIQWLRGHTLLHADEVVSDGSGDSSDELRHKVTGNDGDDDDLGRFYSIKVSHLPANPRTNHFQSVVSTLRWNMTMWPNKRLDRVKDAANYTCRSTNNVAGLGVNSTAIFHVEYPPENISLNATKVSVIEDHIVPPISCHAQADPIESYLWTYDGNPVSSSSTLMLDFPAPRDRSGLYTCTVSNLHGNISASVFLDVLYAPRCELMAHVEEDIGTVLICSAYGNPDAVDFQWLLNNETVENYMFQKGSVSRLTSVRAGGHYTCIANNSVGHSGVCSIELAGGEGALIAGFSDNRVLIIVIVVAAVIIVAILICVVIILVMRRRKSLGKYSNRMDLEPRENPEGHSQPESRRGRPGRKPGVVTFKKVDSDSVGRSQGSELADKQRRGEVPPGGVADGDRAFYENLPFHGLQPAPNKDLERPVPAPRDYSPTKMRHIYQNLLLPLRASKPFKPVLPDLEYADVDFPPTAPQEPPQSQQVDGAPLRPPRGPKAVANNNHA